MIPVVRLGSIVLSIPGVEIAIGACISHMGMVKHILGQAMRAGNIFVDAMERVIIRYNYFRENSGWGLDLDDGASNYHIYNNLCVGVSMKLREGPID